MKKILFLAGALVLLAAACNSASSTTGSAEVSRSATTKTQAKASRAGLTASAQVDALVNDINASINIESTVTAQSDTDILKQDQGLVNDGNGVSNAKY